jgi:hypothetical protein
LKPVKRKAYWPFSFELFVAKRVTTADAEAEVFACEVALTIIVAGEGTAAGAVYNPLEEMLPQAVPEQPDPLTLQVTALFVLPETLARNCCCWPTVTISLVGDIVTATGTMMVTVAEAFVSPSVIAVAVTVTCAGLGTVLGAV